jgi:hypothetical protein
MQSLIKHVIDDVERASESYGTDAMAALWKVDVIRFLDWLPLPRTWLLILCHILVANGRKSYTREDPYGWGAATFSEVSSGVLGLWPLYLVIDLIVFGLTLFCIIDPLGSFCRNTMATKVGVVG